MMGPDELGEEFDDVEEEEKSDPNVVYATLEDDGIERTVTVTAPSGGKLTFRVEGDDVHIQASIPVPEEPRRSQRLRLTVARSALAEAFDTTGLSSMPPET